MSTYSSSCDDVHYYQDDMVNHNALKNLISDYEFETCLPTMDAGEYVLYADLAHESGYSHSITQTFSLDKSNHLSQFFFISLEISSNSLSSLKLKA